MDNPQHRELATDRLTTLTDGVFAIILTLLVFDLRAPLANTQGQLLARLHALAPQFVSFLVSYIVLGVLWYGHMEMHWIVRSDRVHLGITLAFLLTITLVPFSASLMGQNLKLPIASMIYAGNLCLAGIVRYVHWTYATRGFRLTLADMEPGLIPHVRRHICRSSDSLCGCRCSGVVKRADCHRMLCVDPVTLRRTRAADSPSDFLETALGSRPRRRDIGFQFLAEHGPRNVVELVLPSRPMVGLFIDRTQVGQFVDEGLKAVMVGVASDEDRLAVAVDYAANPSTVRALNDGLTDKVNFPPGRHRSAPNSRPGLSSQIGNVFPADGSLRLRHRLESFSP
jgi:uncharacterized membrane protein